MFIKIKYSYLRIKYLNKKKEKIFNFILINLCIRKYGDRAFCYCAFRNVAYKIF